MKQHFCPAEQSMIAFEKECNWCGELESQEPVAWAMDYDIESVLSGFSTSLMGTAMRIESAFPKHRVKLLYTTPPQRTWVGLTDEEAQWLYDNCRTPSNLIDMVEAKLREKNK
jgi:hypothetical protein